MSEKLKILSAGAGAGKTSRLSDEILQAIQSGIPPENIVATTFTTKAADELIERVRLKLLESGDNKSATRILDGYVGTMNSVFGRLLREFALEMGLSPVQKVLAETESSTLFNNIAAEVIDRYYHDYKQVFFRLGQDDWRQKILRIIELARQNGLDPRDVKKCADYSWSIMTPWLPSASESPEQMDERLRSALRMVRPKLPEGDTTKATEEVIDTIDKTLREWSRYESLSWYNWAKLSKLSPGARSRDAISPIVAAASLHDRHPRLHQDMKECIFALFHCAAEAMEIYSNEKSKRGWIDFTDQESLALTLLKNKDNLEVLQDRISEVFVDEFQDSSPLQIALNMQLLEIAKKATWVGDVKQAVYGFRGTDPELMKKAMDSIEDVNIEVLDASYRSRESLVQFVNALFVPVFKAKGISEDKIKLDPKRVDNEKQRVSIETWSYQYPGKTRGSKEKDAAFLAIGVQNVLHQKEKYLIEDKKTRQLRSLQPGDIAILCRSNEDCSIVAEALSKIGISATVGESGLLSTPEVVYAIASMRYLVDKNDTLALTEIIHFSSDHWREGAWLSNWIPREKQVAITGNEPIVQELYIAREKIAQMSPSEVLDLAIVIAKVDEVSLRWGQSDQRLANLDALRSLALQYEEVSETNGTAATTIGFLMYLQNVKTNKDLNRMGESTDHKAIRVLTYHKAKGLEWSFVILNSLERSSQRQGPPPVFNQVTAVSRMPYKIDAPLNGRCLYYWPWPYSKQSTNVALDGHVEKAPELLRKKQLLLDENQRILYVGMTRARDYLVLATRDFSKAYWLKELTAKDGQEVIEKIAIVHEDEDPSALEGADGIIQVNDKSFPCKVRLLSIVPSEEAVASTVETEVFYVGKREESRVLLPARFNPSEQKFDPNLNDSESGPQAQKNIDINLSKIHSMDNRLPLSGKPDMAVLGEMVHAFLAADNPAKSKTERQAMAQALLQRYEIYGLSEDSLIQATDQLEHFLSQHYPEILERHREYPVHLRQGLQKATGWVDLLLRTPKGWVIIDHKTFPGKESKWLSHGIQHLPQLRIYAEALYKATGCSVYEAWIHMPIVGAMICFTEEELKQEGNMKKY
ncbi:UvrD-helicase domain-containing protein [Heliorestis convoluta]|uniref:DNA 3'-5' helicase n=1 Tax=Heliorestis convoluta TaxID=356322 RepID=A0A5Q2MZ99_9FIRM|nr:UvrD-helicase domain-containing protein [Heliorestis convoluta]QGG48007.1 UvrD/REP helicase, putative [Heliorestis convoluta]